MEGSGYQESTRRQLATTKSVKHGRERLPLLLATQHIIVEDVSGNLGAHLRFSSVY
jgi:hypothetical protein